MRPKRSRLRWILVALAVLVVWRLTAAGSSQIRQDTAASAVPQAVPTTTTADDPDFGRFVISRAKTYMRSQLKDPESVRWGLVEARVVERGGQSAVVACGSYNSRNSLGGYTGSKRFISNGTADLTFSEESMGTEFAATWDLTCSGRILASESATA